MDSNTRDQSFLDFLNSTQPNITEDLRSWVLGYIHGFEAARPEAISVHSLIRENQGGDEADESFRLLAGYKALVDAIADEIDPQLCETRLNTIVSEVEWLPRDVKVKTASGETIHGECGVITVPLEVLKADRRRKAAIRFSPDILEKKAAMEYLETGPVLRVTLHFRERFWEKIEAEGRSSAK